MRASRLVLIPLLGASSLAAIAVAAGVGIARAGEDAGPKRLPISGIVRDEKGGPIPAWIDWEGHPRQGSSPPAWRTDVHGRFVTDGGPPGTATLIVTAGDYWSSSRKKVVKTRAGTSDLVIVMDPGLQLLLRIADYVPGPNVRWARLLSRTHNGDREVYYAPIRDDGWTRFVALPADREFELWAEAEVNRRHVRAAGLKPGDAEQRIERQEVMDIAGKIRASEKVLEQRIENARGPLREHLEVDVYTAGRGSFPGLLIGEARVLADGSFRVSGLPPGTYRVHLIMFFEGFGDIVKKVEAGTTDVVFDLDKRE